jgi:putative DNA primase/helicase
MTPLPIALGYIRRGWSPVPIPHCRKGPAIRGWQELRITAADAPRFFDGTPMNIGVITGAPSGGLADADLDSPEAVALADGYLPRTGAVFGRRSRPRSHRLYRAAGVRRAAFVDPADGEMLLELRGDGHQTLAPGSTHPSGEPVAWHEDGEPAAGDAAELEAACARLAAASMLLRCAPGKGRHDFLLPLAGALVRAIGAEDALAFLAPLAGAMLPDRAGEAAAEVARMVAGAAARLEAGEPVPGWPRLVEALGDKRAKALARWLGIKASRSRAVELEQGLADLGTVQTAKVAAAKAGPDAAELQNLPGPLSHDALALELGAGWEGKARHVAKWGCWLFWTGSRWEQDERLLHLTRTRDFLRAKAVQAPLLASTLRSAKTVAHVAGLARSNTELAGGVDEWDRDPWLLGTPDGTVDLRTGKLRPADPRDRITKQTAVTPAPPGTPAPLWRKFLERIFRHDPDLVPYVMRVLGYALTGLTTEHVLIFAWGQGANGKGTLFNTASRVMGGYAATAPADLLLVTHGDRHPTDMAMLRGARLAVAQELAPGRAWDEPKLKSLTGGDPITARFMRQDFFTYEPAFLLIAAGNHKPSLKGVDEAIRRRLQLLPFLQNIPAKERDKDLAEKLKAEWPAILRLMIDGCLEWQRKGLAPPESVREASEDYLAGEDVLGQWLEERCIVSSRIAFTATSVLYGDWRGWCEAGNMLPGTSRSLGRALDERGFSRARRGAAKGFVGIGLAAGESSGGGGHDRNDRSDIIDAVMGLGRR